MGGAATAQGLAGSNCDDALGVRTQGAAGAGGAAEAAAACGEAAAAGVGEVELGGYFGSLFSCLMLRVLLYENTLGG